MIRRPPRSTPRTSSAASDVYKRQPICYPDVIQFAPGLPKTRSGKIMRRILRKIAANEPDNLGDTTTLADPSVVASLVENRQNKD